MGLPIRRLVLATNENDVLDEFFRTLRYRPRATAQTHATSSPSMDHLQASNFERYVFDVVGRDSDRCARAVAASRPEGGFDSRARRTGECRSFGIRLGMSTHADRLATIREIGRRMRSRGRPVTPPTGSRSARARERCAAGVHRDRAAGQVRATIRAALGRDPERPAAYADLEDRPQRCERLPADAARVKAFIAAHA